MDTPNAKQIAESITKSKEIVTHVTNRTIEKLKPFATRTPENDQIFSCFELYDMQNYELIYKKYFPKRPDTLSSMDEDYELIGVEGESFIPELAEYLDVFFEEGPELTEAEGVDWTKQLNEVITNWFSECWLAAGGKDCIVPTYFTFEGVYMCRDMLSGEEITEQEAARRAGYNAVI